MLAFVLFSFGKIYWIRYLINYMSRKSTERWLAEMFAISSKLPSKFVIALEGKICNREHNIYR